MAAKKKPAPDTSAPVATENQADVSVAVEEQSSAAASTEPVTQAEPIVETPAASPEGDPVVTALLVTARHDGFRRAGRSWSRQPTRVEIEELSEAEIAVLYAEPLLDVVGVTE